LVGVVVMVWVLNCHPCTYTQSSCGQLSWVHHQHSLRTTVNQSNSSSMIKIQRHENRNQRFSNRTLLFSLIFIATNQLMFVEYSFIHVTINTQHVG
jgi:hypothetical protein